MLGIFSKTTDSSFIEAIGIAGFDFVIIDQEHGPSNRETLYNHVRAAKAGNVKSIIRVAENNHNLIGAALDANAFGVQVPNIATLQDAEKAISSARFYPNGNRGVCRFVSAASYGEMDRALYFNDANTKTLILQVEGEEGIANLPDILNLKGFDILFVGPYDLSQSLGYPGETTHPVVVQEILKIKHLANAHGIKLGSFADTPETYNFLVDNGFQYIAYAVDVQLFIVGLKRVKQEICK